MTRKLFIQSAESRGSAEDVFPNLSNHLRRDGVIEIPMQTDADEWEPLRKGEKAKANRVTERTTVLGAIGVKWAGSGVCPWSLP